MELFTHTVPGLEREIVHCPLQEESDMECTDAQPQLDYDAVPLTQITTLTSQFPEPESDPDETMVPCPECYSTGLHGDTEEGAHDIVEEEVIDDPVLDPDWQPLGEEGAAGTSSQAEEGYQQQHQSTSQQLSSARPVSGPKRVTKTVLGQRGQPLKVAQRAMPEKEFHSRKSAVWHFFDQDPNDQSKVICKKCSKTFSRGKILQNVNTTCMRRHLTSMHLQAWTNYQTSCTVGAPGQNEGSEQHHIASLTVSPPLRTPPAANVEGSSQGQSRQGIRRLLVGSTVCRPTSPTVSQSAVSTTTTTTTASSTICRSPVQLTLEETLVRKRKYSSSHPRTQGLNAHIVRLILLEMMPYRLVESKAFKDLMAYAVPRYDLPSRHFFARKAIPALHQHVKDRIVHALRQSVSGKVHLTTDAWTSRHGQGRYVSITAHWVNVVDAGSTGDSHSGTVLPSPRSRKQLAVGVRHPSSSSSSSSRSDSSSTECSRLATPSAAASVAHELSHYGTPSGKRQQAVLEMKCLGDNRHTAEILAEFLQQESESWLGSVHLEAGKVVSDNGRNFMAAIALSQLKHIPCLAHTLNLVVQCFLKNYPELPALLLKVRKLCSHIRRSPVHSSRKLNHQRSLNLPQQRLIIDVATRWNSTLHMVQRLCEQRRAVIYLWEDTHTRAGSWMADMELSGVQWSKLQDLCQVLQCFEECTRLVSADDAIISMSIPLMRLLMQSLTHIKEQASAAEEEGSLDDSQPLSGQGTVQDEVADEEDEEEDDGAEYVWEEGASQGAIETGAVARSGTGFLRDTCDIGVILLFTSMEGQYQKQPMDVALTSIEDNQFMYQFQERIFIEEWCLKEIEKERLRYKKRK
ncbi:zinc finger BED domain-containing protein 4-like [Ranitomeya variabilis]|uniref:zinc finger BED domain-containing protein 4-like n=1 Tax=Ranitomeya variabilis TaxID=490064 RepID=UPI004055F0CD